MCGVPSGCGAQIDRRRCGVKIVWHVDGTAPKKVWPTNLAVHQTHASDSMTRLRLGCGALVNEPNTPVVCQTFVALEISP